MPLLRILIVVRPIAAVQLDFYDIELVRSRQKVHHTPG
jgi:hypothetical protein